LFCSKILQTLNPNLLQAWEAMTFFYQVTPPKEKKQDFCSFVCLCVKQIPRGGIYHNHLQMLCYVVLCCAIVSGARRNATPWLSGDKGRVEGWKAGREEEAQLVKWC
jgi:hypothetical protein